MFGLFLRPFFELHRSGALCSLQIDRDCEGNRPQINDGREIGETAIEGNRRGGDCATNRLWVRQIATVRQIDGAITVWVDQGNEISLEYSGTNALKVDIIRYGKQTISGSIKDGISALSRYYLNNFQDVRQLFPVASALLIGGLTVTSITLNRG